MKIPASSLDSKGGHGRPWEAILLVVCLSYCGMASLCSFRTGQVWQQFSFLNNHGARNTNIFLEPSNCSLSPHLYITPALFLGSQTALSRIPSACSQPEKVNSRRKRSRPEHSPQGTGSYNGWGWRASSAVRSTC